jgi:hypothetical protein
MCRARPEVMMDIRSPVLSPNMALVAKENKRKFDEANSNIPADIKDRFEFMILDIFATQTMQADIYHSLHPLDLP